MLLVFFLGLAVHDTSQVIGAAMTYSQVYEDPTVTQIAAITKLSRNVCLGMVLPILAFINYSSEQQTNADATNNRTVPSSGFSLANISKYIPYFVYGFFGAILIRSVGDLTLNLFGNAFGIFSSGIWHYVLSETSQLSTCAIGIAMAAVGLKTSVIGLGKAGIRPLLLGFGAASMMATLGALIAHFIG